MLRFVHRCLHWVPLEIRLLSGIVNIYEGVIGVEAHAARTYCGRALDDSGDESEDNHVQVPIPCAHGGFVHARCMLHRAEHLARGHANPRPCVACRSAWPGGNRPPHPTALARRLPMSGQGERWVAMRSALQFALLFQRGVPGPGPSSNATTGVYSTLS